jgi:hypothetical protein
MAGFVGPEIPGVTDGLLFAFDAALSYQSGSTWLSQTPPSLYTTTLYNNPTFTRNKDSALTFDGADEYAQIDPITYDRSKFSVEVWGKWPIAHPYWVGILFGKWYVGISTANEFTLGGEGSLGPSPIQFTITDGSTNVSATSSFNYTVDTWYQMVGVFDSGSHKLYVNGEEEYDGTTPFTEVRTNNTKFTLASIAANVLNYTCNCEIASIRMYSSKALSASEVLQNYNALKSRFNL